MPNGFFLELVPLPRDNFVLLRDEMNRGVRFYKQCKSKPYRIMKTIDKKRKAFFLCHPGGGC